MVALVRALGSHWFGPRACIGCICSGPGPALVVFGCIGSVYLLFMGSLGSTNLHFQEYGWKLLNSEDGSHSQCHWVEFWNVMNLQKRSLQNLTFHLSDVVEKVLMSSSSTSVNDDKCHTQGFRSPVSNAFIFGSTAASNVVTRCAGEQVLNCALISNTTMKPDMNYSSNSDIDFSSASITCNSHTSVVTPCTHTLTRENTKANECTHASSVQLVDDPISSPTLGGFGSVAIITQARGPSIHIKAEGRIGQLNNFDEVIRESLAAAFPSFLIGLAGIIVINENVKSEQLDDSSSNINYYVQPGFPWDTDMKLEQLRDWLTYWEFPFHVSCASR